VHGVARANIAHRVRTGELQRTEHYGVYRLATAASSNLDDLRAAWLSTNPGQLARERTGRPMCDAVVASAAAALVHGIGDVYPSPYSIVVSSRRQSTRDSITYSWRHLESRDVEIVDGLPVTTRERTIVDLLRDEGDISIAADALRDAVRDHADLDEARFAELLMPHAERLGQARGDGLSALAYLKVTAEVDVASEAATALDRLLEANVLAASTDPVLRNFAKELPGLAAALRASPNAPSGYGRQLWPPGATGD